MGVPRTGRREREMETLGSCTARHGRNKVWRGVLRPRSRSSRDDGGRRRSLNLGLLRCGSSRCGLSGLSSRVLERRDGGRLLDLRGVLLNLGRGVVLSLGLRLEEVTNTGRKATADLGLLLGLLLFVLLLLLHNLVSERRCMNMQSRLTFSSLGASVSAAVSAGASAAGASAGAAVSL